MKKYFVILISLFAVSCTAAGECGSAQLVFKDIKTAGRSYIYECKNNASGNVDALSSEECQKSFELVFFEQSQWPDKDHWFALKVNRFSTGEDVYMFASISPDFKTSLIEEPYFALFSWGNGYETIYKEAQQVNLTPVEAGTDIYVKFCYKNGECTQSHKIHLQDDSSDKASEKATCDGQYRKLETSIIPESVTCLSSTIGGVAFCRYNDTKTCIVENQSDNALTIVMTIPKRQSTVFQEAYLSGGETKIQDCKDLKNGDLVEAKLWRWSPDTLVENIKTRKADLEASFTFTTVPLIEVNTASVNDSQELNIQRTLGVDCTLLVETSSSTDGRNPTVNTSISCLNNSNDKVVAKLYLLKDNPVTADTYIIDYELAQLDLKSEETKDAWIPTNEVGTFLLHVETTGWLSNSNLSADQPFNLSIGNGGWQIEHLDQSVYVK